MLSKGKEDAKMYIKNIFPQLLFTTLILLIGTKAFAQPQLSEYYPIGTTWEEIYKEVWAQPGDAFDGTFIRYSFTVDRDTIIGDKSYKIVNQVTTENLSQPSKVGETLKFLLREQGDSILISDNLIVIRERLIYNFNWQESDSILVSARNKYEIEGLTHSYETLLDGNTYECYSFCSSKFNGDRKYIYKSIGQTIGGLIDGLADGVRTTRRKYLTKFTRNNVLIYEYEYPTPQIEDRFQDYYPIITDDKMWSIVCVGTNGSQTDRRSLHLEGDTIINGMSYSICKQNSGLGTTNITSEYYCAMREEDKKVYRISRDSQEEHLLFDFAIQVGDSLYCMGGDTYDNGNITETSVDESLEEIVRVLKLDLIDDYTNDTGLTLKMYHFSMKIRERMTDGSMNEYDGKPVIWIEGVGSRDGFPLNSWYVPMDSSYNWVLTNCIDHYNYLYKVLDARVEIIELPQISSCAIYDLTGRMLRHVPQKGIYIKNGRKYVVR